MKKLIAMLVALSMMMTLTAAFAASVDADDVVGPVNNTPTTAAAEEEEETTPMLLKAEATEEAKALTKELLAAEQDPDKTAADVFPAELAVEKDAVVQEVISVSLNPEFEAVAGQACTDTLTITADVSKAAKVRVLIGIVPADAEEMVWFEAEKVSVEADGVTLKVTYSPETVEAMKDAKSVTLVVLTVPAE